MYQWGDQLNHSDDCGCSVCNPCPCGADPCEQGDLAMCPDCHDRHVMAGTKRCWVCDREMRDCAAEDAWESGVRS